MMTHASVSWRRTAGFGTVGKFVSRVLRGGELWFEREIAGIQMVDGSTYDTRTVSAGGNHGITSRFGMKTAWTTGLLGALLLSGGVASAAGLFASDRGVRPMGRAGAFVAGADDLGAIYYNPAGLVYANRQVLVDVGVLSFRTRYERSALVKQYDPNTGEPTGQAWEDNTFPAVEGSAPIIPIPTLAMSTNFGVKKLAVAFGAYAPYAAAPHYDKSIAGEPNPGRYMLLNMDGSSLIIPGIWAAYELAPGFSIGAGVQALVGNLKTTNVMSTCLPERFMCSSEAPDYDAMTQLSIGPIFSPGGNIGVTFAPVDSVRLGASFQTPFYVDASATTDVQIPAAGVFDSAYQDGNEARATMVIPWTARAGIEVRGGWGRVELAYVREAWSMHDEIAIEPKNIVLKDVLTFPDEYRVQRQVIGRHFKDTNSVRLGGESWVHVGGMQLDLRAGVMWEQGAVPREYLTTMTLDSDKVIASIGAGLHIKKNWRLDIMYAHGFVTPVDVPADEARFGMLNPVRSNPPRDIDYVNGGHYEVKMDVAGLGLAVNY